MCLLFEVWSFYCSLSIKISLLQVTQNMSLVLQLVQVKKKHTFALITILLCTVYHE